MNRIRISKKGMAVLFLLLFAAAGFAQNGGTFGAYLVGTWDLRDSGETFIQIVNPTANVLTVRLYFWDDGGNFLTRVDGKLVNNDMMEVNAGKLKLKAGFGVVKVLSFIGKELKPGEVKPGVVGFVKHRFHGGITESNLAAVPEFVLEQGELKILLAH
jgi:hypothetical protein